FRVGAPNFVPLHDCPNALITLYGRVAPDGTVFVFGQGGFPVPVATIIPDGPNATAPHNSFPRRKK
ncbi:MAG: hypothetical protein V4490_01915, partial [Pseudomonadota bacterium]